MKKNRVYTNPDRFREKIMSSVRFVLIPKEPNDYFPDDLIRGKFLDLSLAFAFEYKAGKYGFVAKQTLDELNMSFGDLYWAASKNSKQIEYTTTDLAKLFEEISGGAYSIEGVESCPIFNLSKKDGYFGAAAVMNKALLEVVSDRFEGMGYSRDYRLIPSSVHEFLAVAAVPGNTAEDIQAIISEVNAEEVAERDRLGMHPYWYCSKDQSVCIP